MHAKRGLKKVKIFFTDVILFSILGTWASIMLLVIDIIYYLLWKINNDPSATGLYVWLESTDLMNIQKKKKLHF